MALKHSSRKAVIACSSVLMTVGVVLSFALNRVNYHLFDAMGSTTYSVTFDKDNGQLSGNYVTEVTSNSNATTTFGNHLEVDYYQCGYYPSTKTDIYAQMKKGVGYFYNTDTTDVSNGIYPLTAISSITINFTGGTPTIYYGSSENPSTNSTTLISGTSIAVSGVNFFKVAANSSGVTYITSIIAQYVCSTTPVLNSVTISDSVERYQLGSTYNDVNGLSVVANYNTGNQTITSGYIISGTGFDPSSAFIATGEFSVQVTYEGTTSNSLAVTVYDPSVPTAPNSIALNKTTLSLSSGATSALTYTLSPSYSTTTVTWSSSSQSVATVSDNGLVTAKADGTSDIVATTANGKSATCSVTVSSHYATSITLNKHTEVKINTTGSTTLTYTILPTIAASTTIVTWSSSNTSIATVSDGTVTGVSGGSVQITARTNNGLIATCDVCVYKSSLTSGYSITTSGVDSTTYTASTIMEASAYVSLAVIRHHTKVTVLFAFNNTMSSSDFVTYMMEVDSSSTIVASTYATGSNKTNVFSISYLSSCATIHSSESETYPDLLDANNILRQRTMTHRDASYNSFPIDQENNGTLSIYNSEELWWALNHGYKPSFPTTNSKAEAFYLECKDILRNILNDDMSDFMKVMTIYRFIEDNSWYDYASLDYSGNWTNNTAYYLEGFLQHRTCVCDGYSKVMALLCGIENLEVVRGYGYDTNGGHAWNYAKINGTWYLVCPTWGQADLSSSATGNIFGTATSYIDYGAFMTKSSYFTDNSDYNFVQKIWQEAINGATSVYSNIMIQDTFTYNSTSYDFYIDSAANLTSVFAALSTNGIIGNDMYVTLQDSSSYVTTNTVSSALSAAGISYSTLGIITSTSGCSGSNTYKTVLINV
ncbi:MAG: Ig-like domain-containing protein [Bacilli bacterium]|jgi:uncharacterized protein YjdB